MPFSPTLTPTGDATADLRAVRSTLGDAAQYALELRARPADQRDESYADDVRSAIDAITELDGRPSTTANDHRQHHLARHQGSGLRDIRAGQQRQTPSPPSKHSGKT